MCPQSSICLRHAHEPYHSHGLQELRVNWAFQKEQTEDTSAHFHIFVGDLSAEVNDFLLKEAFSEYSECSDARVLWDHVTGRSKSYGFVSFRYSTSHCCLLQTL